MLPLKSILSEVHTQDGRIHQNTRFADFKSFREYQVSISYNSDCSKKFFANSHFEGALLLHIPAASVMHVLSLVPHQRRLSSPAYLASERA